MAETPQTNEGDAAKDEITPADANVAAEAQDAAEESTPPGEEAAEASQRRNRASLRSRQQRNKGRDYGGSDEASEGMRLMKATNIS